MTEPERTRFHARELYGSVIAVPLLQRMDAAEAPHRVVIDLNLAYPQGREAAARAIHALVDAAEGGTVDQARTGQLGQYVVASLSPAALLEVVRRDRAAEYRAIHRIWPDFKVAALINKSCATVKADAAHTAFSALGAGITWAVVDSGIDSGHPHFKSSLDVVLPVEHKDFTGSASPLDDAFGHGTHVAGIIAGEGSGTVVRAELDSGADVHYLPVQADRMTGIAPLAKLVSYKVLDDKGDGETSAIIAALQDIQRVNGNGRDLKIQGVNLSVGYPFDPQWFACGESPLCVEVTRLVKSGVVVVVAAGNTGYGYNQDIAKGAVAAGMDLTINDPGNAEAAITVGSTHREMPHRYGVSYFSSKGPTGDGRAKPDLVAPGERILSCAAGKIRGRIEAKADVKPPVHYVEDSGTSMAAAHVSGAIAAFLSIRGEFVGRPEDVKRIFTGTATDLGRVPAFQGHGLLDLMRAIQSV
ncbi:S8 family peptidase [Amycolatopsis sp. cg5]|uniref:S8 family peptidase n=1 Tax=Amycolatopsis sp. cg5 TaxID=3238802 RepID=UPI003523ED99